MISSETPVELSQFRSVRRRPALRVLVARGLILAGLSLATWLMGTPPASLAQGAGAPTGVLPTPTPAPATPVTHDELMSRMQAMTAMMQDMMARMNQLSPTTEPAGSRAALMAWMRAMRERMQKMMGQPAATATPTPGAAAPDMMQGMMTMMQDMMGMMQGMMGSPGSSTSTSTPVAQSTPAAPASAGTADSAGLVWSAQEGNVTVTVRPLTLRTSGAATLDFEISLQTHSVDLSQDLTQLAALITAGGTEVKPTGWNGPKGGHHVKGVLSFPTKDTAGKPVDGTGALTLVIRGLAGVPERTFVWNLP